VWQAPHSLHRQWLPNTAEIFHNQLGFETHRIGWCQLLVGKTNARY
jgi:hypothetical protein